MAALTNDQFVQALHASRHRTNALAVVWHRQGAQVWLPPLMVAGQDGTTAECVDGGDLHVVMRVEHKVRGFAFSGREDYPYPDVIVDEAYKLAKAGPLLAYVIESEDGACAAEVYGFTRRHWVEREISDSRVGRKGVFAFCPKAHVRFCDPKEVL